MCCIICYKGSIRFKFYDDSFINSNELILGENDKKILFIKPNIWFGFKRLSGNNSLINISNILHDDESTKKNMTANSQNSKLPVVILAGGKGSRIIGYAKVIPKPLIKVLESQF